jgi:hypothetical protein
MLVQTACVLIEAFRKSEPTWLQFLQCVNQAAGQFLQLNSRIRRQCLRDFCQPEVLKFFPNSLPNQLLQPFCLCGGENTGHHKVGALAVGLLRKQTLGLPVPGIVHVKGQIVSLPHRLTPAGACTRPHWQTGSVQPRY